MLTLALRFPPETIEQAKRILVAQQLRGAGGRGLRSAARRFRLLVVPLVTATADGHSTNAFFHSGNGLPSELRSGYY